ncbi:hypothetical protein IFM89_023435 [Coptis chinensis]|uniref:AP2/ERF domain-containing protein n=1 Tax=Coptis chinensis TaxID=261450 RepID=A0A835IY20_9MAGN|nr:hypothetical protein IFM89_023435 [Coptis chinensis]
MEVSMVKCEVSSGKHRLSTEDNELRKSVKRRRREPIPQTNSSDNLQQEQQHGDNSTTGSTVKRSSRFRGVSRHRWTGRFEAHLWDKGSWNVTQKKKGKQGAYDEEESAARAYDLAALKYWGATAFTNFPVSDYEKEMEVMQDLTKEEYLASLRRKSSGFSRGVSKYRGVARHHQNGRWEARIGRVFGNKYLYLGTYTPEPSFFHPDTSKLDYLESPIKPEVFSSKLPISYNTTSSSPTALSLLLRSSIFKELVEKNSSGSSDEIDGDFKVPQNGNDDEYSGIFYNEIADIPYVCSNSESLLNVGVEETVSHSQLLNDIFGELS